MSTFVSLHPCLLVALHTFTDSLSHPSVSTPMYLLLYLLPHSFLHPGLYCPHSLTLLCATHCIQLPPPPLPLSCVLHRYCTFLHHICLLSFCFSLFFLSLLGEPLVTSLLQLPWFRGKETIITVWIKQTAVVAS